MCFNPSQSIIITIDIKIVSKALILVINHFCIAITKETFFLYIDKPYTFPYCKQQKDTYVKDFFNKM